MKAQAMLLWFALFPALATTPGADTLDTQVRKLASLLSDGHASFDVSRTVRSGDRIAVVFVLDGPGGGNGDWLYLAFFEADKPFPGDHRGIHYRLLGVKRIGARGKRGFDAERAVFDGGKLTMPGAAYAARDAMCCPSLPIRATFVLRDGQIVELQESP